MMKVYSSMTVVSICLDYSDWTIVIIVISISMVSWSVTIVPIDVNNSWAVIAIVVVIIVNHVNNWLAV